MLTLYIGNKNYSSWSMRPWVLMRQLGIPFEERCLRLFTDEFRRVLAGVNPAGKVPVLVDDTFSVWDTLAIAEYVAERFPQAGVWPADARDRARARSLCAEMHSGFSNLRNRLPMNVEADLPGKGWNDAVARDVERIVAMWQQQRNEHRERGPFLFGPFCAADAFYAPVVSRFKTYRVALPGDCSRYLNDLLATTAMQAWTAGALAEADFLAEDEPYRTAR